MRVKEFNIPDTLEKTQKFKRYGFRILLYVFFKKERDFTVNNLMPSFVRKSNLKCCRRFGKKSSNYR